MRQGIWFVTGVAVAVYAVHAAGVGAGPATTLADRVSALEQRVASLEAASSPQARHALDSRLRRIEDAIGLTGSAALDALPGSWGGGMSKANLGGNVALDEMFIDVVGGGWHASVRMNMTLAKDGREIPIVVVAEYDRGHVDGDSVHWEKVPWHRTVPSTGQKDDIEGNPLLLTVKPDGGLSGKFEGSDGFTFTLVRRTAPR